MSQPSAYCDNSGECIAMNPALHRPLPIVTLTPFSPGWETHEVAVAHIPVLVH